MRQALVILFVLALGLCSDAGPTNSPAAPVPVPRLKVNDVVVFVGDSITEKGANPDGWIGLMMESILTYRGGDSIVLHGRGMGGWTLQQLRDAFDERIAWLDATVIVIEIGMNDLLSGEYEDTPAKRTRFELGYNDLIWRSRRAGAKPVLLTHTLWGEQKPGTNEYDERLDAYSALIRKIGIKKQCPVIEIRKPFLEYCAANNPDDLKEGILTVDRKHFTPRGHRLMADLMIEAFGIGPQEVKPHATPSGD